MFGSKLSKIPKMVEKNQAVKLAELLKDKNGEVVLAAIDGLGRCTGDEAFNALVPLIHQSDKDVRVHSIAALGTMGLSKARTHLLHQRDIEKEKEVLEAIAAALHKIEVNTK